VACASDDRLPILQTSAHGCVGIGQGTGEFVATSGLVGLICRVGVTTPRRCPTWSRPTSSAPTGSPLDPFTDPAVTLARLTDTFAGIGPNGVLGFVLAQLAGAATAARHALPARRSRGRVAAFLDRPAGGR
jgi:hypothetical protein